MRTFASVEPSSAERCGWPRTPLASSRICRTKIAARPPLRRARLSEVRKAALHWLERYLAEGSPRLQHFAEVATDLAKRELGGRSEAMSDWMPWLIQHDVVRSRNAKHHGEPVALLFDGPSELSAFGLEIRHRFNQVIAHE